MHVPSIFTKRPEPPTVAPEPTLSGEAKLLSDLQRANEELAVLDSKMREFRHDNFGFINGHVAMIGSDMTAAARIREVWGGYLNELTQLTQRRNEILQAWSELRTATEAKTK